MDNIFSELTTIIVRTQKEGIHCYPNAPTEVEFLKSPHRHVFHIEVEIQVFHDDRELEFIIVKRDLDKWLNLNVDYKSCEMIAKDILNYIDSKWDASSRYTRVDVFEDGENGARVTRNPFRG